MKLHKDGTLADPYTRVGELNFKDQNGSYDIEVYTDGEFWRVIQVEGDVMGLLPSAARKLAKLLLKAADIAEKEDAKIDLKQAQAVA